MYEWVVVGHVVSVISWLAGLLYLPRLFVYHSEAMAESQLSDVFKVMERKLFRVIMTPGMVCSWGFGIWLAALTDAYFEKWFCIKVLLVLLLTGYHFLLARWLQDFRENSNAHSPRFFRMVNEVPTVLMIGIVVLVIVKPF